MTIGRSKEWDEGEYRINVRLPLDLGASLRQQAERNCRSINNELIFLVKESVKSASQPTA